MRARPEGSNRLRVLVVDDHPAVRQGLALLLSTEGMELAAEASERAEALAYLSRTDPDMAIVDLSLDKEDGLQLVADLKERDLPSLVYSMHSDARHVQGAFAAGAFGYVTKSEFRGVLVEAIRNVAARRRFVSPKAAVALAQRIVQGENDLALLSRQEHRVYRLVAQGEGTQEIAAAMNISTRTVESYYARIQLKLGLEGMHDVRRHAIDQLRRELL